MEECAFDAYIANCPNPVKIPFMNESPKNFFSASLRMSKYEFTAFLWKLNEYIVFVFITHSDNTPPASISIFLSASSHSLDHYNMGVDLEGEEANGN